jgi:hypothetical protein
MPVSLTHAAVNGTRPINAPVTRMAIFQPDFFILKINGYHDKTTVLNERKHLKMVIRSVPNSVSLFVERADRPGLTTLHRAH